MGTQEQRIRELHEKPSPSIFVSNLRGEALKNSLQLASPAQSRGEEKPASTRPNCLCSPTTHPGSFRCRILHGEAVKHSLQLASPTQPRGEEKPASIRPNCLCSPTTHPGSFRCRIHRNPLSRTSMSVGSKLSELANKRGALQAQER